MGGGLMQIGEVAEQTGLSLRTIRYYEEVGLVVPSARSQGGFRLYTGPDVGRLLMIKRMKPLDFSLAQMREVLDVIDRLGSGRRIGKVERARLQRTLGAFVEAVEQRCAALRCQLSTAEEFGTTLTGHLRSVTVDAPVGARR